MKKIGLLFLSILALVFFVSCTEGQTDVSMQIDGIKGYTDADIDNTNHTISFSVGDTVETFDINDIIIPKNITIEVFSDANLESPLDSIVKLNYGLNTFYISLSNKVLDTVIDTLTYTLNITRLNSEVAIKKLEVKELKDTYFVGEEFSPGILLVTYADETVKEVSITLDMVSGFNTNEIGKKVLVITYEGNVISFDYEVKEVPVVLENIKILSLKSQYFVGDTFENGELELQYSDETTKIIDLTIDLVTGFDTSEVGTKTLTVTYNGLSVTYTYEVLENNITDIVILELKNVYQVNDVFENGKLELVYANGTTKEIALTIDLVTGFDTSEVGTKTLTVTYEDLSVTYNYEVKEVPVVLEDIKVISLKSEYFVGDTFENGKLELIYSDQSKYEIMLTISMVTGFDTSEVGTKTLTVTYEDLSVTYTYEVKERPVVLEEIKVISLKSKYFVGDTFENGELELIYSNATTKKIDLTIDLVTGFDTSEVGTKTLTVTYNGLSVTYTYEVEEVLELLNVSLYEFQYHYVVGDNYVPGLLALEYASKTEYIDVTSDMVTGFTTKNVGQKNLVITYKDYVINLSIYVQSAAIDDIVITPSEVTKEEVLPVVAKLFTLFIYTSDYEESNYNEQIKYFTEDVNGIELFDNIYQGVVASGISKTSFEALKNLIDVEIYQVFEDITNLSKESSDSSAVNAIEKYFGNVTYISNLKNAIRKTLEIITPEMLAKGLVTFLTINELDFYQALDNKNKISLEDVIDYFIKLTDNEAIISYLDNYLAYQNNFISYGEMKYILEYAYSIIFAICDLDDNLILEVAKFFGLVLGSNSEMEIADIHKSINAVGSLAKKLYKATNGFKNLEQILDIVFKYVKISDIPNYDIKSLKSGILAIADNLYIIGNYLENVSYTVVESFFKFINDEDYALNLKVVIKDLLPLISLVRGNDYLKYILSLLYSDRQEIFISNVIERMYIVANEDSTSLTESEVAFFKGLDSYKTNIQVASHFSDSIPAFTTNVSTEDFYNLINMFYSLVYYENGNKTPFTISLNNTSNLDLSPGLHYLTVSQNNQSIKIPYLVVDNNSNIILLYNLLNVVYGYNLNAVEPSVIYDYNNDYLGINEFIQFSQENYYYDFDYQAKFMLLDNLEISISGMIDNTNLGLNYGFLKVSGFVDSYIPYTYYVYDNENPKILEYDYNPNVLENTEKIEILFHYENASVLQKEINLLDCEGFNPDTFGPQTLTYYFAEIDYNIELNINYLSISEYLLPENFYFYIQIDTASEVGSTEFDFTILDESYNLVSMDELSNVFAIIFAVSKDDISYNFVYECNESVESSEYVAGYLEVLVNNVLVASYQGDFVVYSLEYAKNDISINTEIDAINITSDITLDEFLGYCHSWTIHNFFYNTTKEVSLEEVLSLIEENGSILELKYNEEYNEISLLLKTENYVQSIITLKCDIVDNCEYLNVYFEKPLFLLNNLSEITIEEIYMMVINSICIDYSIDGNNYKFRGQTAIDILKEKNVLISEINEKEIILSLDDRMYYLEVVSIKNISELYFETYKPIWVTSNMSETEIIKLVLDNTNYLHADYYNLDFTKSHYDYFYSNMHLITDISTLSKDNENILQFEIDGVIVNSYCHYIDFEEELPISFEVNNYLEIGEELTLENIYDYIYIYHNGYLIDREYYKDLLAGFEITLTKLDESNVFELYLNSINYSFTYTIYADFISNIELQFETGRFVNGVQYLINLSSILNIDLMDYIINNIMSIDVYYHYEKRENYINIMELEDFCNKYMSLAEIDSTHYVLNINYLNCEKQIEIVFVDSSDILDVCVEEFINNLIPYNATTFNFDMFVDTIEVIIAYSINDKYTITSKELIKEYLEAYRNDFNFHYEGNYLYVELLNNTYKYSITEQGKYYLEKPVYVKYYEGQTLEDFELTIYDDQVTEINLVVTKDMIVNYDNFLLGERLIIRLPQNGEETTLDVYVENCGKFVIETNYYYPKIIYDFYQDYYVLEEKIYYDQTKSITAYLAKVDPDYNMFYVENGWSSLIELRYIKIDVDYKDECLQLYSPFDYNNCMNEDIYYEVPMGTDISQLDFIAIYKYLGTRKVNLSIDNVIEFSTNEPGEFVGRVQFEGKIYEFNYKVADFEAPKINSVEFLNKDSYELYAPYKDMEAKVYYSDDSTDYITITVDMVTNFDTSTPGKHVACVHIGDMSFDYVYYVNGDIEKVLESIDIESLPKEYHLNSNFIEVDVLAYYSDGSKDYITITVDMVAAFDTSKPGEHFDAIIVEGIEFEYIYIVLEGEEVYPVKIDPIGIKREYEQYEGFTPGEVDVYYIDDSTKKMFIDESMLIGFNTETPGDHVAYINIEGYHLEYCYTVIEKVIEERI